jgi:Cohesin loading factor
MSESEKLDILMEELANLDMFIKLLKYASAKQSMLKCFQALLSDGKPIAFELCNKYVGKIQDEFLDAEVDGLNKQQGQPDDLLTITNHGLRIGSFFSESGCLEESLSVLSTVLKLIGRLDRDQCSTVLLELSCLQKLLHAQAAYSCFKEASQSSLLALNLIRSNPLDETGQATAKSVPMSLLANLYQQISVLHFCRSEYDFSYKWSLKALKCIRQDSPTKIIVDVLRQAAKSCVVKRRFQCATMLIKQAVTRAR